MEKIKSVLHGHKKDDDVAHDSHNTSSSTTQGQQQTPIHDQMTSDHGRSTVPGQPHYNIQTTSGRPYTDLAQPSGSAGLHGQESQSTHGVPRHVGTDGPIGQSTTSTGDQYTGNDRMHEPNRPVDSTSTTTAGGLGSRPDAHPHSHTQDASQASIKSGIIGFGPEENQGHAAMARHNPTEQSMDPKQVLGAGQPGTAGRVQGSNIPQGYGDQQSNAQTSAIGSDPSDANPAYTREQQPYENTLRQESYTADTDRSFPLAGGVTSRHHDDPTTEHTSALHDRSLGEREPGTKEKRVGFEDNSPDRDGYGRGALAGAAAAATGVAASKTLSPSEQRDVQDQGLETRQATYGDEPPATQAYSGNTGDVTGMAASRTLSRPEARDVQDQGLETRQATYGGEPPAMQTQSGNTGDAYGTHDRSLPETVSAERPSNKRLESHQLHIPGEFPETPGGDRNTFLDYSPVVEPAPPSGQTSIIQPTSTLDPSSGQGSSIEPTPTSGLPELRHTGTLDEPRPRSSDENHHGRDAAIAGGLGAGAAGLGMHAASHKHDTPEYGSSKPLYEETNPYSSKSIDPRVSGNTSTLGEQRFDPQARTGASPAAQISDPSNSSAVSGPPVSRDATDPQHHYGRDAAALGTGAAAAGGLHHALGRNDTPEVGTAVPRQDPSSTSELGSTAQHDPSYTSGPGSMSAVPPSTRDTSDSQHHYGRDAAMLGTGAAAAGGLHHALGRNDTPETGSAVPSQDLSHTSGPGSMSGVPDQTSNFSKPLPSSGTAATQQPSGGKDTFYGTPGAPAPVADKSAHHQEPSSALGHTSSSNEVPERQPEHHYGRNAGLVGAAGAATAGGLYAANRNNQTDNEPASNAMDPYSNNGPASNTMSPYASNAPNTYQNVGSTSEERQPEHHYGRDAGVAGAGAATAGGLYAANHHNRSDGDSASNTMDPHSSTALNTHRNVGGDATTGPYQSDTLNRADPRVDETDGQRDDHHYGRNAAAVGGAGAAGYGAYEVAKAYGDHKMTQPAASMEDQRYDPTTSSARAPNPVAQSSEYNYHDPNTASNVNRTDPNDHVNRNAALGGAGLAAAGLGAGAYAGSRHHDDAQGLPLRQKHGLASEDQSQSSYPMQDSAHPTTQQPHESAQDPHTDNNDKRNAALGTAGAAGLGGAAYAYSQRHEDAEAAKRDALMKEKMEKEQQEALKKDAHDREKDQHKLEKEQHKHEKTEEHRLAKEHDKEQARLAKEQHAREKEAEKEAEGEEKKKGGLLGFLHRDKSKKEKKSSPSPDSSPRQSRDYSPRGSLDDNNPESPRWKGKHRLHKDPPKGHPAREAMEHQNDGDHDNIVTDPHTGLPMNTSLGSGAGGTDGNPAIRGQHTHPTHPAIQKTTDWDAVKKNDTPY